MEKMILVNPVETSSQPSSSRMNLDGNVVKIAITESPQMPLCQVVLAKDKTTAITTNHLEDTIKALERNLANREALLRRHL